MYRVLKPPASLDSIESAHSVFLAGSIEMGVAEDWQTYVSRSLENFDITVLNPRREEWDSTWEQVISNPKFREQVEWELAALELSTVIGFYFEPSTKSPITLLELGLFARTNKLVVCCPDGFWRKGNVDIVCARFGIETVDKLDDLVAAIQSRLN